ncbi:hypothetical protein Afer_0924 [Acidimicrobium ferrooxidans DSM 10331]|uniref:Uncharacterized protein n=1 Tax=Acidimicrobium ferrooxidans (strain DSM 10331 / JCM 15462 / NBRC 103882 / ICP) TaxID=525909 RepID=C7LYR1_ACIFD|nr:hypothetical protein [Acidimicrobium ferrooxidans]ACU53869.1 hypothetical protein Afer_0924 [Acidimicrobium ferrooxidans DSM 10331]
MASRIEVELTSHDAARGEWTWRAVGARHPRGTVPASLVWEGASVGDVARAEIARRLDGIEILSLARPDVAPPRTDRIDIVGSGRAEPPVTIQTVRRERRPGARGTHDRDGRPRQDRRAERRGRPGSNRDQHDQHDQSARAEGATPQRSRRRDARPAQPEAPAAPRLRPRDTHRRAFLESVIPEHRPIAEALVRGGMPEVRAAIARDREAAAHEGRAPAPEEATLKIAEDLLPRVRTATWLDRADAALAIANTVALRDLRSVVASVDPSSKDPSVLDKATTLREVLNRRIAESIERWHAELREAVESGRTVRALRLASRLPDPSARIPDDVERALVEAVDRELIPDTPPERWMVLIDAIANSPIRRAVTATGLPEAAPAELVELAKEQAGRIPSLGRLLGVTMPAPPKPEILARVPKTSRKPRQGSTQRDDAGRGHAESTDAGAATGARQAEPQSLATPDDTLVGAQPEPADAEPDTSTRDIDPATTVAVDETVSAPSPHPAGPHDELAAADAVRDVEDHTIGEPEAAAPSHIDEAVPGDDPSDVSAAEATPTHD